MIARRTATLVLLLAGVCAGQQHPGTDPRDVPDPRTVKDPRPTTDPRTATDPRDTGATATGTGGGAQVQGDLLWDSLYASGDEARLATAFKQSGWSILHYVDKHCEGWMSLLEHDAEKSAEGKQKLADMQTKGRKLAAIADRALGDTRFSAYVENFYGWNADQRKSFREGQALYKQGEQIMSEAATPEEQLRALTPLRQSLEHSRPLNDTWGQSMALAAIGRVQELNGQTTEANATMDEARRLGREIRDLSSVWDALAVQYEIAAGDLQYQPAKDALQEQYLIAMDLGDEKTQQLVTRQMVELDKLLGPH